MVWYKCDDIVRTLFKVTGKIIRHKQVPDDSANAILKLHQYNLDYHSFGDKLPDRQGVESATLETRGELIDFEEYLEHNPLNFQ